VQAKKQQCCLHHFNVRLTCISICLQGQGRVQGHRRVQGHSQTQLAPLRAAVAKLEALTITALRICSSACRAKAGFKDTAGFKATAKKQLAPLRAAVAKLAALTITALRICSSACLQGQGRVQGNCRVQGDSQEAASAAARCSRKACGPECYCRTYYECTVDEQHDCCFWRGWRWCCCKQKSKRAACRAAHDDRVSTNCLLCTHIC
jgi:hypothetical protein